MRVSGYEFLNLNFGRSWEENGKKNEEGLSHETDMLHAHVLLINSQAGVQERRACC
jgi:hypothetical protein